MSVAGYFDYASATPVDPGVFDMMAPYFTEKFYNPSSMTKYASEVRAVVESSRSEIAGTLGVRAQEIIFTSGCTEANNLAIHGVMSRYPQSKVLVSAIEHDSIYETAKEYIHEVIPVLESGRVDRSRLAEMLDDDVVLVSIMYVNNEIGTIQSLREIGNIIADVRKSRGSKGLPLYLHCDAAQAANYLNLKVSGLRVDMMSLNSGKIYGPKGVGCLYVDSSVLLSPLLLGGGQERSLRSGTENVPGIVGFAHALKSTQLQKDDESERLAHLQRKLFKELIFIGGAINGTMKERLPNNINVRFEGIDNERLVFQLDTQEFMISSGSACHAKSGTASRTLEAIGLTISEANESIRITMGRGTTLEDVEGLIKSISQLVAKNR